MYYHDSSYYSYSHDLLKKKKVNWSKSYFGKIPDGNLHMEMQYELLFWAISIVKVLM